MTHIHLQLPRTLAAHLESVIGSRAESETTNYIISLINQDQQARLHAAVERAALEGLKSGPAEEWDESDWNGIREEGVRRAKERGGRGAL